MSSHVIFECKLFSNNRAGGAALGANAAAQAGVRIDDAGSIALGDGGSGAGIHAGAAVQAPAPVRLRV